VTPCRLLVGSQSFGDTQCLHLQSRRGNGGLCSSKARVLAFQQTQTLKSEDYNLDHDHSDNLNFTQHTFAEVLNFPFSSETSVCTLLKPPTPYSDSHTPTSCAQRYVTSCLANATSVPKLLAIPSTISYPTSQADQCHQNFPISCHGVSLLLK